MKTEIYLVMATLIGLGAYNASALTIGVPSEGTCVRQAGIIVKGMFSADGDFLVTSTFKGQYKPQQRIPATKIRGDRLDFSEHQGKECIILGMKQDDGILLQWSWASAWPYRHQSLLAENSPMFGEMEFCTAFITAILDYEKLEQRDPQALATRLIQDVQNGQQRPFALAYLDSYQDTKTWRKVFGENEDLRDDVIRIVAAHIVTRHVDDGWTFHHMLSFSPVTRSITLPYFLKIAKGESEQAQRAVLGLLCLIASFSLVVTDPDGTIKPRVLDAKDFEAIKAQAQEKLPMFQQLDAKKNIHLFDSPNEAIAGSASLVFSTIFNEPAPKNMTRAQEKAFWQAKIKDGK